MTRTPRDAAPPSAEERLRQSYTGIVWGAILLSTLIHFLIFSLWPAMGVDDVSFSAGELELAELPPEVEIPPPPEAIARPAVPVVAEGMEIDESVTIAETTWDENPVSELPPPPDDEAAQDLSRAPTFTPYTVRPDVKNRAEVQRTLVRKYPPLLRDAGIGGQVLVWFFIDENGRVRETLVKESSGHAALDQVALEVARVFRFTPAMNRDKRVPVWIAMPIVFQSR